MAGSGFSGVLSFILSPGEAVCPPRASYSTVEGEHHRWAVADGAVDLVAFSVVTTLNPSGNRMSVRSSVLIIRHDRRRPVTHDAIPQLKLNATNVGIADGKANR